MTLQQSIPGSGAAGGRTSLSNTLLFNVHKLVRSVLFMNAACFATIAIEYVVVPGILGLQVMTRGFFAFILITIAFLSILGGCFYDRKGAAGWNIAMLAVTGLLFFALSVFLNGPFNQLAFIFFTTMLLLNLVAIGLTIVLLVSSTARQRLGGDVHLIRNIDWHDHHPRTKIAALILVIATIASLGAGFFFNWGAVITIKAPDGFKTTSSYWGPPALSLATTTIQTTPVDNNTLVITPKTINTTVPNFINGSLAYVVKVTQGSAINYCNYSAGAQSYPNGTIRLSPTLPIISNVSVTFSYVTNHAVLEYLGFGNSTLIMNHHSSGESNITLRNGFWYYNDDFFASIERTYLFQLLDYWGIHYYLNVHNGIDFPHVFNYRITVPQCYVMIDWFIHQRSLGLCSGFLGISPDFEPGSYEKLWWTNYTSSATPLSPGSLLPGIIPEDEWYYLNCQNVTLFADATAAWDAVYTYASERNFSTYIVLGGGEMRDSIDGDVDTSILPTIPTTRNPHVRFGIMSYQDGQTDVQGGRFNQYRDCIDQIAIYGDRGRSILTGWIATGTRWYTDDALGLGRYIEDVLIAQAAGMTEIFHAPLYRLQGKWGDEAVLLLHQALNEWPKHAYEIVVPWWDYSADYMDAVKNFNHEWQFFPAIALVAVLLVVPFVSALLKRKPAAP
ncbi:MAG: hypothetical protein GYA24_06710 [Candidatus Lokiarchaeota archaeon]|nr:hypothetical protein [Candidatus Lokiarchaeota archaeon]